MKPFYLGFLRFDLDLSNFTEIYWFSLIFIFLASLKQVFQISLVFKIFKGVFHNFFGFTWFF